MGVLYLLWEKALGVKKGGSRTWGGCCQSRSGWVSCWLEATLLPGGYFWPLLLCNIPVFLFKWKSLQEQTI